MHVTHARGVSRAGSPCQCLEADEGRWEADGLSEVAGVQHEDEGKWKEDGLSEVAEVQHSQEQSQQQR